jgi:FdhE protein
MTRDVWLSTHPYLRPIAEFQAQVQTAVISSAMTGARVPNLCDYTQEFRAGVPLLRSSKARVDLEPIERIVLLVVESLSSTLVSERLRRDSQALAAELAEDATGAGRAVAWLLGRREFRSMHLGLLRHLGWTTLSRYLRPVAEAFNQWRDEERWMRCYCPTCGSVPAMAQLVGTDPGRLRLLSCGCCGTRWRYARTRCPFCENEDNQHLASLVIEGEASLRIDHCESCRGYIKTYIGGGNDFLLEDWTSLHLDLAAQDRGLKRMAASIYQL